MPGRAEDANQEDILEEYGRSRAEWDFNGIVVDGAEEYIEEALHLHDLRVTGRAIFLEVVDAEYAEISGACEFQDFATCDTLQVLGSCECREGLLTEGIGISGSLSVCGRLWANSVTVEGSLTADRYCKMIRLKVKSDGFAVFRGKVRLDKAVIHGILNTTASLHCIEAKIRSERCSYIRTLFADELLVERTDPAVRTSTFRGPAQKEHAVLLCDLADCGDVDLTDCRITQLFCEHRIIRKGCRIRELVYRSSIEIEPGAVVEKLSRA